LSLRFCNHSATTEIYTLSLHDALPIWQVARGVMKALQLCRDSGLSGPCVGIAEMGHERDFLHLGQGVQPGPGRAVSLGREAQARSEEHTSELQSLTNIVCRLLLEKKKH